MLRHTLAIFRNRHRYRAYVTFQAFLADRLESLKYSIQVDQNSITAYSILDPQTQEFLLVRET